MCGRFTLRAPASVIAAQFGLFEMPPFTPRFNIAPTQMVPVVRQDPAGKRQLSLFRWGLVPSWARDPAIGNSLINARAETVAEKPAFRTALRKRRCLVVADGFYEWQGKGRGKVPHFFRMRDEQPFAFAGLWEHWEAGEHSVLETCTLLTTTANTLVAAVHDRMPVILAPEHYGRWLDTQQQAPEALADLLRPYSAEAMIASAVSPHVNSPAHEDPQCIVPV